MDFQDILNEIPEELRQEAESEASFDDTHYHATSNHHDITMVTMMVMAAAQQVAAKAHKEGRPQEQAACAILDGMATALGMTLSAFSGPTDHAKRVNGKKAYRIAAQLVNRDSQESQEMMKHGIQIAHAVARGDWEPPKP